MRVSEVMTRKPECVRPDDTLQFAARKMRDLDVGPLPVCGDNDRLAGMITDRDITVRAVAEGWSPAQKRVGDVMTQEVIYCFEDQGVEEAARLMQQKQVRRLVVLNRDKRLTGIVSLGDLAVESGNDRLSARTLEEVSEPTRPAATGRSTAAALFDTRRHAEKAIEDLRRAGFANDQIGVATRHVDPDVDEAAGAGAAAGTLGGGALGALAGIAVGAGLVSPIGPLVAGGALAGILASTAVGAVAGGVVGSLVGMGLSDAEARYFESELAAGRSLVTVRAGPRADEAAGILRRAGGREATDRPAVEVPPVPLL